MGLGENLNRIYEQLLDAFTGTEKYHIVVKHLERIATKKGDVPTDQYGLASGSFSGVWFEVDINFAWNPLGVDMGFRKKVTYETTRKLVKDADKLETRLKSDIEKINELLSTKPYEFDRRINPNDIDFFNQDFSEHLPPYLYRQVFGYAQEQGAIEAEWIQQNHVSL